MLKLSFLQSNCRGGVLGFFDRRSRSQKLLFVADLETDGKILLMRWSRLIGQLVLMLYLRKKNITIKKGLIKMINKF